MPYEQQKREQDLDMPSLAEMTAAAITLLSKGDTGFFLLVGGGLLNLLP